MNNYGKDYVDSFNEYISRYISLAESNDPIQLWDRYAILTDLVDTSPSDEPEDTLCSNNYSHN